LEQQGYCFDNHIAPSTKVKMEIGIGLGIFFQINLVDVALITGPVGLPGKHYIVLKMGIVAGKGFQFGAVQNTVLSAGAEDEVYGGMGNAAVLEVGKHTAKRHNSGSGTDHDNGVMKRLGQDETTFRAFAFQHAARLHFLEEVLRPQAVGAAYYTQFNEVGAIGPGGNGVAAPAVQAFFTNWQIERDELTGAKRKLLQGRNFDPKAPDLRGFVLNVPDNSFVPDNGHNNAMTANPYNITPVGLLQKSRGYRQPIFFLGFLCCTL
jgi:hypothetical protein